MGNTMSCFDRWGKRAPDGPLLNVKPSGGTSTIIKASSTSSTRSSVGTTPASSSKVAPSSKSISERPSRRRRTYSSKTKKSDTELSSYDDISDDNDSDESEDGVSAKDIRQRKIIQYRRNLTKIVKLKTHLFSETVKVTCAKDGSLIEWYKGKSDQTQQEKKKAAGSFPVDKITLVKSHSDNPKALVITVNNPQSTNYNFTFASREEREAWQEQVESFMKFMAMK